MWPSATGAPLSATSVLFVHAFQLSVHYYGACPRDSLVTLSITNHTAWTHILEEPGLDSKIPSMFKIAFMYRAKVTLETSTSWTIWKTPVRPTCIAASDHLMFFPKSRRLVYFSFPSFKFLSLSIFLFTFFHFPDPQIKSIMSVINGIYLIYLWILFFIDILRVYGNPYEPISYHNTNTDVKKV